MNGFSPGSRPTAKITSITDRKPSAERIDPAFRDHRHPRVQTTVTVVVPTYKEAESLPHLIDAIAQVREQYALSLDLIIVDDDSGDGSVELIEARREPWIQMVVRGGKRGLSEAVLAGLRRATGEVLVCMDADLSHPPDAIPRILAKLQSGADFVVGSRYVEGGSTSHNWGFLRWANSRIATVLARPITSIKDPMAGFFALRRSTFEQGTEFNPVGYKIGLELMVKCGCERVVEVPIHFEDRRYGKSKLTLRQQLLYLQHLRRLYIFKHRLWTELTQFLIVGALGTVVNLGALTLLMGAGLRVPVAVAAAIFVAICFNFVLNRRFSFSSGRSRSWPTQFAAYLGASSLGAVINYAITLVLISHDPSMLPQLAAAAGIAVATTSNFIASRYLVFRASHIRPSRAIEGSRTTRS